MKKNLFIGVFALLGFAANAQTKGNFKLGTHIGVPTGNLADVASFNVGIDMAYLFNIDTNFKAGFTTGYSHYFVKDYTIEYSGGKFTLQPEDIAIIPVAATAKYNFEPNFFIGADLGYAFFVVGGEGTTGAFYFQPRLGYQLKNNELYISYKGMSKEGTTIGSVNLGYAYTFK
ncbi:hypothetical protein ELOC111193_08275 [Elizabethkingia occulta]|uniref:Outer membrane protein beta-barrel domain-containing protein n=1 Tax=Elizabethkingia occulta TaxID=1867263 RepID=A0A1T3MZV6_9FLAO|nr:hypothetical protein [Elizabethkingia occulta]OPC69801.1 hypothetical protein BAZ10_18210 [Elizabethkingia occulta]